MPAATFADGPTSGQFTAPNPYGTNLPPYLNKQPVQGFSAVLDGPGHDTFHFLVDNGFGAKNNSADSLLRIYTLAIDFRTRHGGKGTVSPADWKTGRPLHAFDSRTRLTLNDANHLLGIGIDRLPERNCPVGDALHLNKSPSTPCTTTSPPWTPGPGPISTIWSAARMVSSSCSTTMTVLPMSRRLSSVAIIFTLSLG